MTTFVIDENKYLWEIHSNSSEVQEITKVCNERFIYVSSAVTANDHSFTEKDYSASDVMGTYSVAIAEDGTLWSWGNNVFGQLGLG